MKFFTPHWWSGLQEDVSYDLNVFDRYRNHLNTLANQLPPGVSAFSNPTTGHDCLLHTLNIDSGCLTLTFLGPDQPDIASKYDHEWLWTFAYPGLVKLDWRGERESDPPYVDCLHDLGYHEFDMQDGLLIHRLLFRSGVELIITARSFEGRKEHSTFPPRTEKVRDTGVSVFLEQEGDPEYGPFTQKISDQMLRRCASDPRFQWLGTIALLGTTTFNAKQAGYLLAEWKILIAETSDEAEKKTLTHVESMLNTCVRGGHLSVVFYGT
jgi:hypothetical protein